MSSEKFIDVNINHVPKSECAIADKILLIDLDSFGGGSSFGNIDGQRHTVTCGTSSGTSSGTSIDIATGILKIEGRKLFLTELEFHPRGREAWTCFLTGRPFEVAKCTLL
jgi:hypothetical protein